MFESLFTDVRTRDHELVVYRRGEPSEIEKWFEVRGISVDSRTLPPAGPEPFAVIETDDRFRGAIGLADLAELFETPVPRPGKLDDVSEGYRILFEMLEETMVTAMERRHLLAVSREIEDRAYRVGSGTLRVGFQTLSTFESQLELYRQLAATTALDIHIHGVADWEPPEIPGITYHGYTDDTLERYWLLAFDGGPDPTQVCALVAQEQSDGYRGFWTSDAAKVETILETVTNA